MDLAAEIERLAPWYQSVRVGNMTTPGWVDPVARASLSLERLPPDLTGKTVIDVGGNCGGVALEFAKRGASTTVLELGARYIEQGRFLADFLGLPVTFERATMYDISSRYDYVVCYGVIYHLRHPFSALDTLREATGEWLFISSKLNGSTAAVWELANVQGHTPGPTEEAHYNWWFPSLSALQESLLVYGFADIELMLHDEDRKEGFWAASPAWHRGEGR